MLYHVSQTSGLKTLQPHVSTHKKLYVYAVQNIITGLLFGAKQDDFDFIISTDDNDVPTIWECYPNALREIYGGKRCSVYEVDEKGFQRGVTSWSSELVCESKVEVINEIVVEDLYQRLSEEEQNGNIKICRYEFSDEYRKRISKHIVDRFIRFEIDLDKCMEWDEKFSMHYSGIIQELNRVTDGHLLQ